MASVAVNSGEYSKIQKSRKTKTNTMKNLLLSLLAGFALLHSATLSAQTIPSYVPTTGLVAYYPLDGTAADLTTNNNTGTMFGPVPTLDRNGKLNGAMNFNGTSDYISVQNAASLNPNTAITISAWIKASAFGTNSYDNTIVGKDDWSSGNRGYALRCGDGGKLSFNFAKSVSTWSESVTFLSLLTTTDWFFVTGVYDGSMISTYVNGAMVGSLPCTGTMVASTTSLLIGSCPGPSNPRYFSGKIDEVSIWNRALTQLEITAMYIGSLPSPTCLPNYVATNGLVSWWPFCGNGDDLSSNGNHATVNNATLTADRNGLPNSAYDFDGTSSFLRVFDSNTLDLKDNYTLSGWYKINDLVNTNQQTILGKARTGGGTGYALSYSNGGPATVLAGANDGAGFNGGVTGTVAASTAWHHLAVTYNGATMRLYQDGVETKSTSATFSLQNSTEPLYIGRELTSLPRYFSGKLDDIGMWNRALGSDEVLSLFTGIKTSTTVTGISGKEAEDVQLVLYPNPTGGLFTVTMHGFKGTCTYLITDISGRKLQSGEINAAGTLVDISQLEPGIYIFNSQADQQRCIRILKE